MTEGELFEEQVLPIARNIDNLLHDKKVDHVFGLLALATLLGKHLEETNPGNRLPELLKRFVFENIEIYLQNRARESN